VKHLLGQIRERTAVGERVLVTTLTKRMAEDLSAYFSEQNVACRWLHSELDAFERVDLLRDLREGKFEVLVGVNLLREGLDLPEVSLVAIMDADKEGFLRSETSLIQTIGRAARNVNAKVILYGDKVTESMRRAIDETQRRREIQQQYNIDHGITPETIRKNIRLGIEAEVAAHREANRAVGRQDESSSWTEEQLQELETEMHSAAAELDFERAAQLRDRIAEIRRGLDGTPLDDAPSGGRRGLGPQKRKRSRGKSRVPRPKQP
jgi:excinuclease ABC subunit B